MKDGGYGCHHWWRWRGLDYRDVDLRRAQSARSGDRAPADVGRARRAMSFARGAVGGPCRRRIRRDIATIGPSPYLRFGTRRIQSWGPCRLFPTLRPTVRSVGHFHHCCRAFPESELTLPLMLQSRRSPAAARGALGVSDFRRSPLRQTRSDVGRLLGEHRCESDPGSQDELTEHWNRFCWGQCRSCPFGTPERTRAASAAGGSVRQRSHAVTRR